jgi:dTDP-L-rhamnose 4-epimerase
MGISHFRPMKILVTGGAGFIGSHLVDRLVELGHDVTIYDSLEDQVHSGQIPPYLNSRARFIKADLRDYESLKKFALDAEIIFHLAAAVGVGQSQYEIKKYIDVNIGGSANLVDILANNKNHLQKLILAASMSSYGEGAYLCKNCGRVRPEPRSETDLAKGKWEPSCLNCNEELLPVGVKEEDKLLCSSIYAITKMAQEEIFLNFGKTYAKPVVILRFFNVYGTRQSLSNPYTGVAAIFISRLKNNNPPVIYEDGLQRRDFVHVNDIIDACILSMNSPKADDQILNVGTGNAISIKELAEKLTKLMGKDIKPVISQRFRKGDVRHCYPDISKIKDLLGYKPRIPLEEGLRDLIEGSKDQEAIDRFEDAQKELLSRKLL